MADDRMLVKTVSDDDTTNDLDACEETVDKLCEVKFSDKMDENIDEVTTFSIDELVDVMEEFTERLYDGR